MQYNVNTAAILILLESPLMVSWYFTLQMLEP